MMMNEPVHTASPSPSPSPSVASHEGALASLVDSIGNEGFGPAFANYLHVLCEVDHFVAFRMDIDDLCKVAACCVKPERTAVVQVESYFNKGLWKQDPAIFEAQRCMKGSDSMVIRVDLDDRGYAALRPMQFAHVRDRMLVFARHNGVAFGLSVLRTSPHPLFGGDAIHLLEEKAHLLVALLSKHVEVAKSRPDVALALSDLSEIESCVNATCDLPRRESEVCSRILYGMSTLGISIDLSISAETVKTYRKRAYQRLHIGCERELLNFYLRRWSRWRFDAWTAGKPELTH